MNPAARKKGWTTCHLEIVSLTVEKGGIVMRGSIVETKTGLVREEYYTAVFDEDWEPVLTIEDILAEI